MNSAVLICGGAGFIGTNLAARVLERGRRVLVYDDLSRPGVGQNLEWLRERFGSAVECEVGDVRDARRLRLALRGAGAVFHFAAQTAVTTSVANPRDDFDINAAGTVTVLEELRQLQRAAPLVFTSTNKVYGDLNSIPLRRRGKRYEPQNREIRERGIAEDRPLSFHSPYGCSKGAADQYMLDYARTFGMPNIVFRMSCIYGPHQCGTEDQGWVAHFAIQALTRRTITIFGDGMQVRDALYVDDLVDALLLASENAHALSGMAFNIGGGPANTISLLELLDLLGELDSSTPGVRFEDWRIGDQRYYVSDTRAFERATGWRPRVGLRDGVSRLYAWLAENHVPARAAGALYGGVR
jgi:CDP-paratose 2-epimerase